MQTFLPSANLRMCAKVLDRLRLNKQMVECRQILSVIESGDFTRPWGHHPAVQMWAEYPDFLRQYHNVMLDEWRRRGYTSHRPLPHDPLPKSPWWLGEFALHESHQGNLLRKNFTHYSQFFSAPIMEGYLWPSREYGVWIDRRKVSYGKD